MKKLLLLVLPVLLSMVVTKSFANVNSTDVAVNATNFPDTKFRNWILENISGASDGVLTADELNAVTSIDCRKKSIQSLKGIEYFVALTSLDCYKNQLTSLDVSKNTALTVLDCTSNQLTSLDVSKNTALKELLCFNNQLTSLDVNNNTALKYLDCYSNQLTTLDVSKNTALIYLSCGSNQLVTLDVSKNTALRLFWCGSNQLTSLDLSNNTNLTNIIISSQSISSTVAELSSGLAVPVASDFDIAKVTDLQLGGASVTGSIVTVDNQKYLVFAALGTVQGEVDGKALTYKYDTNNTTAGAMDVSISLTYTTAISMIKSDANKAVIYDLKGNRLDSTNGLSKGIYIINGKKTVVK